jgi:hypothetical protein
MEKSLAAQAELEHRQQQITAELNKGFEPAARYEELKASLNALNRELTKAGVEIEASPELSNLDEEAFRPVESGISVHQILSLTEQPAETGEEGTITFNGQTPITAEVSVMDPAHVIEAAADARPVCSDSETQHAYTRAEGENESKNGFFAALEEDHVRSAATAKRGAASKSAAASGASQQMCFNWS